MRGKLLVCALLCTAAVARADEPARTPLLFDLTHELPEILSEATLASVTYQNALQGTTYVRVDRLSFEMPLAPARWYAGLGWDTAIGQDDSGAPRFLPGNPELWGRGVWTAAYGLSFGGGLSFVIPTKAYGGPADPAATVAYAAITARKWDTALFDPNQAMVRPFLDVRLVTGPITVCYRQGLEIASDFSSTFQLAAVGTVYFGVRLAPRWTAGIDVIEYYLVRGSTPQLDQAIGDSDRPFLTLGLHVAFESRYFRPSIGVMASVGSPLNAISEVGSTLTTTSTSFVGVHFSLDFPIPFRGFKKKN